MKALALITNNNDKQIKWLFDRILAMVAYDVDISIVFVGNGCKQLIENKVWKALPMYGVDEIYDFDATLPRQMFLLASKGISSTNLRLLAQQADIIL